MTDHDLRQALRDCYTRTGSNVVDAGLLQAATLIPDLDAPGVTIPGIATRYVAHIRLHAPGLDDTVNAQLAAQIENRLLGIEHISSVRIVMLAALFPILS